jgi:short subunit dehydrogenase-like uncharacterized protein
MTARELDLVLFGATGFTGRLVAEYLATRGPVRWAIAGRDRDKLASLGIDVPIIVADALDAAQIGALARRTRAVCTTVGPYRKYGGPLVAACADAGTHYCDLTGEVPWMREMIDAHHARARQTGARIVHACGFDSIPSDLGTWATQQEMIRRSGAPATKITALFGPVKGGFSGGTAASALLLAELSADPAIRRVLADPYALDPDGHDRRPRVRSERSIGWNAELRAFTMPFVMADTNTRVVRRSHALAGLPWGEDFVYREMMSAPGNPRGLARAVGMTGGLAALAFALKRPALRVKLASRAPKPGDGPSPERRAAGYWRARFVAEGDGERLVYQIGDRGDPGYASTARMLGESALCLALDRLDSPGGVLTPSTAMAEALVQRLRAAGLEFEAIS